MRTILVHSNGLPMETFLIDEETGQRLRHVAFIQFDPLNAYVPSQRWTATLVFNTDSDSPAFRSEKVYIKTV